MIDDFIGSLVVAALAVIAVSIMHWLHARGEQERKFSGHRPDMRVLTRDPYSTQDAYSQRLRRQS